MLPLMNTCVMDRTGCGSTYELVSIQRLQFVLPQVTRSNVLLGNFPHGMLPLCWHSCRCPCRSALGPWAGGDNCGFRRLEGDWECHTPKVAHYLICVCRIGQLCLALGGSAINGTNRETFSKCDLQNTCATIVHVRQLVRRNCCDFRGSTINCDSSKVNRVYSTLLETVDLPCVWVPTHNTFVLSGN
jgi:hypothetical protein